MNSFEDFLEMLEKLEYPYDVVLNRRDFNKAVKVFKESAGIRHLGHDVVIAKHSIQVDGCLILPYRDHSKSLVNRNIWGSNANTFDENLRFVE
jgi:hypothetical protein